MLGLAGLNRGVIDIETLIADPGYYTLPGDDRRYRDWIYVSAALGILSL